MRYFLFCCLLISLSLLSFYKPNNFTVTGKVTDDKGVPVQGVTVNEKGTSSGASTDATGNYKVTVINEKSVLIFTAIGFDKMTISIKGKSTINVTLKASSQKLEEAVVMGYSRIDNEEYTPPVRAKVIAPPTTSGRRDGVAQQLQGKVAGLSLTGRSKKDQRFSGHSNKNKIISTDSNFNTEDYDNIVENRFLCVDQNALSTFSIDVDAASYSNVRRYLEMNQLPPAGAVRIEEMINYFHYDYPQPQQGDPFSINTEMAGCPWNINHKLVLIGLQGKKVPVANLPASNIVFLIDVSGSMMEENKLPLVKASMKLLVDQLREQDKISLVAYAGNAGLVLAPTSGAEKSKIKDAIDRLEAGGSTAGGQGIKLAYKTAIDNFIKGGNNRVILCTDGDFNVGASSDDDLIRLIEEERKSGVFLTVLGYGMGNYKDNKMEKLADKGNGNHAYIDGINEAKKVLVNEFGGTLFTIAKDVKLQVEFNPAKVQAYRLIGYENRLLNKEDFNNDQKDAGELGSGHTVTALYEVVPVGVKNEFADSTDKLKYQPKIKQGIVPAGDEIMTIKFRYKKPDGDISKLIEHPVMDNSSSSPFMVAPSSNFRFAAAVAEFGMLLRNSEFKQSSSYDKVWKMANEALGKDQEGYRKEFLKLVKNAHSIANNEMDPQDEDRDDNVSIRR